MHRRTRACSSRLLELELGLACATDRRPPEGDLFRHFRNKQVCSASFGFFLIVRAFLERRFVQDSAPLMCCQYDARPSLTPAIRRRRALPALRHRCSQGGRIGVLNFNAGRKSARQARDAHLRVVLLDDRRK